MKRLEHTNYRSPALSEDCEVNESDLLENIKQGAAAFVALLLLFKKFPS
jgi:hypothetical protein